jgi:hypothetical protein
MTISPAEQTVKEIFEMQFLPEESKRSLRTKKENNSKANRLGTNLLLLVSAIHLYF